MIRQYAILLLCLGLLPVPAAAEGAERVAMQDGVFVDSARQGREVPYRIYRPAGLEGPHPVVIFSHGLGGSARGNAWFGRYLARNGYIVVHVQHHGSDESVWRGEGAFRSRGAMEALERSIGEPGNALHRFLDISFVIDELERMNADEADLWRRMDLERIGMAGHSYGARSALVAAGERIGPGYRSFREERIRAAVMFSPNLPRRALVPERAYGDIAIPLFHITGTEDRSPLPGERDMDPARRTEPFGRITTAQVQYLLVLNGADHAVFSGGRLGRATERPDDARQIGLCAKGVLAFFEAHLRGDIRAREWLAKDFADELGPGDRFEVKKAGSEPAME